MLLVHVVVLRLQWLKRYTDRNFVGISLQQVLHFDLEEKYYGEHFSKSNYYILVVKFAHSK